MKAKQLIEILKENPEFELRFLITKLDDAGMCLEQHQITEMVDVGYSNRVITLGGVLLD